MLFGILIKENIVYVKDGVIDEEVEVVVVLVNVVSFIIKMFKGYGI